MPSNKYKINMLEAVKTIMECDCWPPRQMRVPWAHNRSEQMDARDPG